MFLTQWLGLGYIILLAISDNVFLFKLFLDQLEAAMLIGGYANSQFMCTARVIILTF